MGANGPVDHCLAPTVVERRANSPVDYCLAPTVVERRAHAFGNNVAFSDAKAAPACRRHALFFFMKL